MRWIRKEEARKGGRDSWAKEPRKNISINEAGRARKVGDEDSVRKEGKKVKIAIRDEDNYEKTRERFQAGQQQGNNKQKKFRMGKRGDTKRELIMEDRKRTQ